MPDEEFITVAYEVFIDAGFVVSNPRYTQAGDCFLRDPISDALDKLLAATIRADVTGEVVDSEDLYGLIEDLAEVSGFMGDDDLLGEIDDSNRS